MADRWQQLQDDIGVFTDKTFGESTPQSKAHHLAEEAMEAAADPSDIIEWADCTILLLDAVRKAGFTTDDLYAAVQRKMEINKSRKWGDKDQNGVVRHVK
ncbi:MAG: DUF550 domain-containing protein [Alphaproteobacteria bacterium]|nr:DUF550 domain-containing protein [Alphaproteobacteria bacterium]